MLHENLIQIISETKFKNYLNFIRFCLIQEIQKNCTKDSQEFLTWENKIQNLTDKDLESIFLELDLGQINDFIFRKLEDYLKDSYQYYQKDVEIFEQKYQMSWDEMNKNLAFFTETARFDEFEMEDDFMNWLTFSDFAKRYKERLNRLQNGRY